jgi:hypothetical protein
VEAIENQVTHVQKRMGRLRKRKPTATHELSERERTLQQMGIVGSFTDTRPRSSRRFGKFICLERLKGLLPIKQNPLTDTFI